MSQDLVNVQSLQKKHTLLEADIVAHQVCENVCLPIRILYARAIPSGPN